MVPEALHAPRRPVSALSSWFLAAVLLTGGTARAQLPAAPRITLRLESVTAAEAAAALGKAAGVSVSLYRRQPPDGQPAAEMPDGPAGPRETLTWNDVTFVRALRQLCERFQLRPGRSQNGDYVLYPGGGLPAAPFRKPGLVTQKGVRLYLDFGHFWQAARA